MARASWILFRGIQNTSQLEQKNTETPSTPIHPLASDMISECSPSRYQVAMTEIIILYKDVR